MAAPPLPAFVPHPLARGPMVSTLLGALPRGGTGPFLARSERVLLRIDADARVRLQLDAPDAPPREAVLLLHGLAGSSESPYVVGTARKAVGRGILAARLNARGCGGTGHLARATYHGGETDDLLGAARFLAEERGIARIHVVGFSIGGNQVLALAARLSVAPPPWLGSIVTVCPCIDFGAAARGLERGWIRRRIARSFLRRLAHTLRERARAGDALDLSGVSLPRTIREFDERFTAPLSGFAGADDYYARAGMVHRMEEVRLPNTILAARDDPLVPFSVFAGVEERSPATRLIAPEHGGHVAFLARNRATGPFGRDPDRRWAENRVVDLLQRAR